MVCVCPALPCPALVGPGWPEKLELGLWGGCQGGLTAEPRGRRQPVPACFLAPGRDGGKEGDDESACSCRGIRLFFLWDIQGANEQSGEEGIKIGEAAKFEGRGRKLGAAARFEGNRGRATAPSLASDRTLTQTRPPPLTLSCAFLPS